jgi:hypothetical protein
MDVRLPRPLELIATPVPGWDAGVVAGSQEPPASAQEPPAGAQEPGGLSIATP